MGHEIYRPNKAEVRKYREEREQAFSRIFNSLDECKVNKPTNGVLRAIEGHLALVEGKEARR